MPRNILNLPSYTVTHFEEGEHDYHIWAEASDHPTTCPHCDHNNIVGFGRREQLIRDLRMHALMRAPVCQRVLIIR